MSLFTGGSVNIKSVKRFQIRGLRFGFRFVGFCSIVFRDSYVIAIGTIEVSLKNRGQDSYMGCPRLFYKNHDFYIFITWGIGLP